MSQEHLLEKLYTFVTGLKQMELDGLLDEDSDVVQMRAAAQMSVKVFPPFSVAYTFRTWVPQQRRQGLCEDIGD